MDKIHKTIPSKRIESDPTAGMIREEAFNLIAVRAGSGVPTINVPGPQEA
jgi:hypothetical protein